jgi:hypothetical protein
MATGKDDDRAGKLYNANILLSQAFHPLLSQFEVIFRNGLDSVLSRHFGDSDWIVNEKAGFMNDQSLRKSQFYLRKCVESVENKLNRSQVAVTSGKVISDQTFGFWTAFFTPLHYRLVNGQPIHVFAHKPSAENRASIYGKLEAVKEFRNRVNHCEPICFNAHVIDCSNALNMRTKVFNLIEWIEPGLVPFFAKMDTIEEKISMLAFI